MINNQEYKGTIDLVVGGLACDAAGSKEPGQENTERQTRPDVKKGTDEVVREAMKVFEIKDGRGKRG